VHLGPQPADLAAQPANLAAQPTELVVHLGPQPADLAAEPANLAAHPTELLTDLAHPPLELAVAVEQPAQRRELADNRRTEQGDQRPHRRSQTLAPLSPRSGWPVCPSTACRATAAGR
jgi:hypothetical protein